VARRAVLYSLRRRSLAVIRLAEKEGAMPASTLVTDLVIRYGFQLLGALIIVVVGLVVARWVGKLTDSRLQRKTIEPPMRKLVVQAVKIVVLLFTLVVALDKLGFQIAPLVAGIGVAGLGIGFALQGVLSNLVAGLTIIFTKPFRVGEYIELLGVHGDVVAIELSATTLLHPDRSRVVIPNRKIVGEILHNFGTMRQISLSVLVPRTADLAVVLAVARELVDADPRVLRDPAALVGITQVTEAGIKIGIQPWARVTDVNALEPDLYRALVERLGARGIGAPVPQHEVRMLS
jgi:small conductance mechanosensitive channel